MLFKGELMNECHKKKKNESLNKKNYAQEKYH